MTEEKIKLKDDEENKFKTLVKCAEKYIVNNAEKLLNTIRNTNVENSPDMHTRCMNLIKNKYEPKFKIIEHKKDNSIKIVSNKDPNHELDNYDILERFCVELQNYQAMPRAINYKSYNHDNSNYILDIIKDYFDTHKKQLSKEKISKSAFQVYHIDLYRTLKNNDNIDFDETKELTENQINKIKEKSNIEFFKEDNGKYYYNYAWYKYARGLYDAITEGKINKDDIIKLVKELNEEITEIKNFKDKLKNIQNFNKDIYYLGDTLTFDFFKELACENLVKADIHIQEIFKKCIYNEEHNEILNNLGKDENIANQIAWDFITLCNKWEYTPYYIDKILWLCCTGYFYEDGITIDDMTRPNFIKYYKGRT